METGAIILIIVAMLSVLIGICYDALFVTYDDEIDSFVEYIRRREEQDKWNDM